MDSSNLKHGFELGKVRIKKKARIRLGREKDGLDLVWHNNLFLFSYSL